MATEDYTTYTEVDPNADLTVTAGSIVAAAAADNPDNYVYKDFGVGHFDESAGDILHTFEYSNNGTANGKWHPWLLCNTLDDAEALKKTHLDGYSVEVKYKIGMPVEVKLNDYFGETKTAVRIVHANNTTVYGQIDWTAPSSGTMKISIFTDAARTTHATDSPQTLTGVSVPCRYHMGMNAANKGGDTYDATSSSIDLNEGGGGPITFFETMAATSVGTSVVARTMTASRTLAPVALAPVVMSKGRFSTLAPTAVGTAAMTKGQFATLESTSIGTPVVNRIRTALRTLAPAALGSPVVDHTMTAPRTLILVVAANPSMTKGMFQTLDPTAVGIAALVKARLSLIAMAVVASATPVIDRVKTALRTLSSTSAGVGVVNKGMFTVLTPVAAGIPAVTKGMFSSLVSTSVGMAELNRKMFLTLTVTEAAAVALTAGQALLQNIAATSVGTSALSATAIFVKTVAAVASGTATFTKQMFVTLASVTAASTAVAKKMFVTLPIQAATNVIQSAASTMFVAMSVQAVANATQEAAAVFSTTMPVGVVAIVMLSTVEVSGDGSMPRQMTRVIQVIPLSGTIITCKGVDIS